MKFRFVQLYDATIYIEGEFTARKTSFQVDLQLKLLNFMINFYSLDWILLLLVSSSNLLLRIFSTEISLTLW